MTLNNSNCSNKMYARRIRMLCLAAYMACVPRKGAPNAPMGDPFYAMGFRRRKALVSLDSFRNGVCGVGQIPIMWRLIFCSTTGLRGLIALLLGFTACAGNSQPSEAEVAMLVGKPVQTRIVLEGSLPVSPGAVVPVFLIKRVTYDPLVLSRWAKVFQVRGEIKPLPADFTEDAPGWWVQEMDPDNPLKWRCVYFSERRGIIAYKSGDDGHRWDMKSHRDLIRGVPTVEEAVGRIEILIGELGLDRHEFRQSKDGKLSVSQGSDVLKYVPRGERGVVQVVKKRSISVTQSLPVGEIMSIGGAGTLTVSFISEGKIADAECELVKVETDGKHKGRMKAVFDKSMRSLTSDNCPADIKAARCRVVYPLSSVGSVQTRLWPFIEYSAKPRDEHEPGLQVYVPAW